MNGIMLEKGVCVDFRKNNKGESNDALRGKNGGAY